jgi:hypothetical protein
MGTRRLSGASLRRRRLPNLDHSKLALSAAVAATAALLEHVHEVAQTPTPPSQSDPDVPWPALIVVSNEKRPRRLR